jgi:hypothetical protein
VSIHFFETPGIYLKHLNVRARLGFHDDADSSRGVQGCDAVQGCGRIPMYQRIMLPPSSGTSIIITRRQRPEDYDLTLHVCTDLYLAFVTK